MWDEVAYQFLNFNGAAVEVWEGIHALLKHVISHPCWDYNESILVKETLNTLIGYQDGN